MIRRVVGLAFSALLFALGSSLQAQQPAKVPRIGYLDATSLSTNRARIEALREGLRELGYVEGKNIFVDLRFADGKLDRLPALAAELVSLKVNILVSGGGVVTSAAKAATSTIPIVMTNDPDPVANGFVGSLRRPGGNITGLSNFAPELSGKRFEILREVVSHITLVAVFGTSTSPTYAPAIREIEFAAKAFGVKLQYLDILDAKDIETAFRAAARERANAVLTLPSRIFNAQRAQISDLAIKNRLPAIYHQSVFVEETGGLMFYGVNVLDLDRRAATYVDRILKGTKPGDLPVEQPKKFEFIINLKAAKQIGLTIPPNVLARADRVIRDAPG